MLCLGILQFSAISAATQKSSKLLFLFILSSVFGRSNREPSECGQILKELEQWTSSLKGELDVIHRLAAGMTLSAYVRAGVFTKDFMLPKA